MNTILFDQGREDLLPLTYTRPISEFRCGILTLREKIEKRLENASLSNLTAAYLQKKYPVHYADENLYIAANLMLDKELANAINRLAAETTLVDGKGKMIALRTSKQLSLSDLSDCKAENEQTVSFKVNRIDFLWDIFRLNGQEIENDYDLLTAGRMSQPIDSSNTLFGERIFLEEGAKVRAAILNSESGAIYIGKNAELMEGSVVRGGLALCDYAVLKLSSKVYGATTIGPYSKVGGEVNNSVIFAYSNKGHDGFLGNSVIGEWCNLGADTNVSNLKNNYASIKVWNYNKGGFLDSGLQFCGLMMGDHSKAGINTMFNTATVVGVSSNVFGSGFPRNFIPSFSWGGAEKWTHYRTKAAFEVAERMMERRGLKLGQDDRDILNHIEEITKVYRNF